MIMNVLVNVTGNSAILSKPVLATIMRDLGFKGCFETSIILGGQSPLTTKPAANDCICRVSVVALEDSQPQDVTPWDICIDVTTIKVDPINPTWRIKATLTKSIFHDQTSYGTTVTYGHYQLDKPKTLVLKQIETMSEINKKEQKKATLAALSERALRLKAEMDNFREDFAAAGLKLPPKKEQAPRPFTATFAIDKPKWASMWLTNRLARSILLAEGHIEKEPTRMVIQYIEPDVEQVCGPLEPAPDLVVIVVPFSKNGSMLPHVTDAYCEINPIFKIGRESQIYRADELFALTVCSAKKNFPTFVDCVGRPRTYLFNPNGSGELIGVERYAALSQYLREKADHQSQATHSPDFDMLDANLVLHDQVYMETLDHMFKLSPTEFSSVRVDSLIPTDLEQIRTSIQDLYAKSESSSKMLNTVLKVMDEVKAHLSK